MVFPFFNAFALKHKLFFSFLEKNHYLCRSTYSNIRECNINAVNIH